MVTFAEDVSYKPVEEKSDEELVVSKSNTVVYPGNNIIRIALQGESNTTVTTL